MKTSRLPRTSIGTITGGSGMGGGKPRVIVTAPADAGFLADQVVRRLKDAVTRSASRPRGRGSRRWAAAGDPAGFSGHVLARRDRWSSITPDWCQALAKFLPTGLTMDALIGSSARCTAIGHPDARDRPHRRGRCGRLVGVARSLRFQ